VEEDARAQPPDAARRPPAPRAADPGTSAAFDAAAKAAAKAKVEDELGRIEALLKKLGKDTPLAPQTPHAAALAELGALRSSLTEPAAIERAEWEIARRTATDEAARGFPDLLRRQRGALKLVASGGKLRLEGTVAEVTEREVTLATLGGRVTLALADLALGDIVEVREQIARTWSPRWEEREEIRRGTLTPPHAPLAAAFALVEGGKLAPAVEAVEGIRDPAARQALSHAMALRIAGGLRELVEADRFADAWARLTSEAALAEWADFFVDGELARLRASFPERVVAAADRLLRGRRRAEARAALDVLFDRSGAARPLPGAPVSPDLAERAAPLVWQTRQPGEWQVAGELGAPANSGRFWAAWPRAVEDDTDDDHAVWRDVGVPDDVLASADGVIVHIDRGQTHQAGLLIDYLPKPNSALMLWMDSKTLGWQHFRDGDDGANGWKTFKTIAGQVVLDARIEAGTLVVTLDGIHCFSLPWPHAHLRGLGLYVNAKTATFSGLALRKAK
jgi:hypothetical protein